MNPNIDLPNIREFLAAYNLDRAFDNSQVKRRMRNYIQTGKLNIPIIRAYRIYLNNIDLELPVVGVVKVNVD